MALRYVHCSSVEGQLWQRSDCRSGVQIYSLFLLLKRGSLCDSLFPYIFSFLYAHISLFILRKGVSLRKITEREARSRPLKPHSVGDKLKGVQ